MGILSQRDEVGGKEGSSFIKGGGFLGGEERKELRGWGGGGEGGG